MTRNKTSVSTEERTNTSVFCNVYEDFDITAINIIHKQARFIFLRYFFYLFTFIYSKHKLYQIIVN